MNDNPRIYLDHEQRPDSIERRHDWRIYAHNQQARIRGALLRERRLARDLAKTCASPPTPSSARSNGRRASRTTSRAPAR